MTEFAKKPISRLKRFWYTLKRGLCPGITPDPCPHLTFDRNKPYWTDAVFTPFEPKQEKPPAQLLLELDERGIGKVYLDGNEVLFVTGLHIDIRPGEPVKADIIIDAREGFCLSATKATLTIQQKGYGPDKPTGAPAEPAVDTCEGCQRDKSFCGICMRGGHGNDIDFYSSREVERYG